VSWRLPLLVLGFVSLALGIAGGLARLAPLPVPGNAIALHGPLMVSAFFGTVIALERAVALGRLWGYGAPLCAGLGGLVLLLSFPREGLALMVLAAAVFVAASIVLLHRQVSVEGATLLAGAAAWLAGNAVLFHGGAPLPWWIAFFSLTIAAERLELSRYLKRGPWVRRAFVVLDVLLFLSPLQPLVLGAVLFLLALWLAAFDIARVTIRQKALTRYVAACLLAGYFWLGLAGAALALDGPSDAALHAFFLGFVFSMVFGHAPVILPAVLRVRFPYSPVLYIPLFLLHASLLVRVLGGTVASKTILIAGAWGNAAAIAVFIVTSLALVLRSKKGSGPFFRNGAAFREKGS
jgi:hypothetical protein